MHCLNSNPVFVHYSYPLAYVKISIFKCLYTKFPPLYPSVKQSNIFDLNLNTQTYPIKCSLWVIVAGSLLSCNNSLQLAEDKDALSAIWLGLQLCTTPSCFSSL